MTIPDVGEGEFGPGEPDLPPHGALLTVRPTVTSGKPSGGRGSGAYRPPWARAVSTRRANAAGSLTARSARTFRSRLTPAFLSPLMNAEYGRSRARHAALMRRIQRDLNSRFFARRSRWANARARSTVSAAVRYRRRRPPQ